MPEESGTAMSAPPFDQWAIIELLGHRRLAARVREVQIAGAGFLRLDIPATADDPARTQLVTPGSVYAIHPVDEAMARAAAAAWRYTPMQRWELQSLMPAPDDDRFGDGPGDDDPQDEEQPELVTPSSHYL